MAVNSYISENDAEQYTIEMYNARRLTTEVVIEQLIYTVKEI